MLNMNNQRVALLILLNLSAAFDTVHGTMLRRLEYSFGIQGKAISWSASYLSGRTHLIRINETLSKPHFNLECGLPQSSCLGPILFMLYTSKLFEIIKYHLPMIHCYVPVKSKFQHPPPGQSPGQLKIFGNFCSNPPVPPRAEKLFKCPIIGLFQVIKCPHPG